MEIEKYQNKKYKAILNLSKEYNELADYFSLEIKRKNNKLTKEEEDRISDYIKHNDKIATLEECLKLIENGSLSKEKYDKLHSAYRAKLALAIKKARVITDSEFEGLEEYFAYEKERDSGEKTIKLQSDINKLAQNNKFVADLENARALLISNDSSELVNSKDKDYVLTRDSFQSYKDNSAENYEDLHSFYERLLQRAKQNMFVNRENSENEDEEVVAIEDNDKQLATIGENRMVEYSHEIESPVNRENVEEESKEVVAIEDNDKQLATIGENRMVEYDHKVESPINDEKPKYTVLESVPPKVDSKYSVEVVEGRVDKDKLEKRLQTVRNKDAIFEYLNTDKPLFDITNNDTLNTSIAKENTSIENSENDRIANDDSKENSDIEITSNERNNSESTEVVVDNDDTKNVGSVDAIEPIIDEDNNDIHYELNDEANSRRRKRPYNDDNTKKSDSTADIHETKFVVDREKTPLGYTIEPINDKADEVKEVNVDGKKVKVRTKGIFKAIAAFVLGVVSTSVISKIIPDKLLTKIRNFVTVPETVNASYIDIPTTTPSVPTPTPFVNEGMSAVNNTVGLSNNPVRTETSSEYNMYNQRLQLIINQYFDEMNVNENTRTFIMRNDVQAFLSQYKNVNQIREVLSALCYGYEANILCIKEGNFRLDEDKDNYLRAFTNDFLCAKVVVNNYTPLQMRAVFGNTQVTYEQVMDGFRGFYDTVATYGTTAVEPLPFKYLTNGENDATKMLNSLFEKLIVVNTNRKNGTLTREHTDAFIVELDKIFIQNEGSVKLNSAALTIGRALADSFMFIQSNVFGGDALVLSRDYGLSIKGLSLRTDENGQLTLNSKNGEVNILENIMNTSSINENVYRKCVSEQEVLLNNINEFNSLASKDKEGLIRDFENLLYRNNMAYYANKIANGEISKQLLEEIESINPALANSIDMFEESLKAVDDEYIPYNITVNGIDELLGIKGYTNDYATLINIRRDMYLNKNYRRVRGYTTEYTTTTTSVEKVDYNDLTTEEKKIVDKQVADMKSEEQDRNDKQVKEAQEVAQEIVTGIQEKGMTEEEAVKKAGEVGIVLEENLYQNLKDMYEGKEVTEAFDAEIERKNGEEIKKAEERNKKEIEEQNARRDEEAALIAASTSSSNETKQDVQVNETSNTETKDSSSSESTQNYDSNAVDLDNQTVYEINFEDNGDVIVNTSQGDVSAPVVQEQTTNDASVQETVVQEQTTNEVPVQETVVQEQTTNEVPVQETVVQEQTTNEVSTQEQVVDNNVTTEANEEKSTGVDLDNQTVYEITFEDNGDVKVETNQVEVQEAPKEEPKQEAPKEEPKQEAPKEEPKQEAPKEEPKQEAPKEEPKQEAPKEEPKQEAPKEEPKQEAPKEEPKQEAPKEEPKQEAPKEEPKQEAPKEETVNNEVFDMIDPNRTEEGEEVFTGEVAALRMIRDELINLESLGLDTINTNDGRSKVLRRNA